MVTSPTLELIHPQTEVVLYEFETPRFGDKGVIVGREAMVGWFGNRREMGLISLNHLVIEAIDWRFGEGELVIRDISKNGTTPAHVTLKELPSYTDGAESAYLVIKLAQSPLGLRVRYPNIDNPSY